MTIKVLDAICGSGKTVAMLRHMARNHDRKYLFVTPLLTESEDRIPDGFKEAYLSVTGKKSMYYTYQFCKPSPAYERTKAEHLKELVAQGRNISTTHSLFSMLSKEVIRMLIEQNYVLVIDEAIECVGSISDQYNQSDVYALLEGGFVSVDPNNRKQLVWREDKYPNHDGKYALIRNLCRMEALHCHDDKFLMTEYPPALLQGLQDIYVLTYMFNGSDMRCWLNLNNIPYEYVDKREWGVEREDELKEAAYSNIQVLRHKGLDKLLKGQNKSSLSLSWFNKATVPKLKPYITAMESLVNVHKGHKEHVYWTTFKDCEKRLKGKGYTAGPNPETPAWIAKNTRATNAYKDFHMSMFACNSYRNPLICRYLSSHNVDYAYDEWSTSELVQFIFRGRIRTLQPQKVVILSRRMQELFNRWRESL